MKLEKLAKLVKFVDPAKPVRIVRPVRIVKPVKVVKPAETREPTGVVRVNRTCSMTFPTIGSRTKWSTFCSIIGSGLTSPAK